VPEMRPVFPYQLSTWSVELAITGCRLEWILRIGFWKFQSLNNLLAISDSLSRKRPRVAIVNKPLLSSQWGILSRVVDQTVLS
jgi:hypothetical protein